MKYKWTPYIIISFVFLLLWGCSERPLVFQVRYAEVLGLAQDDPVYFGQNEIGKVKKVFYTKQADYLVEISVAPEFVNAVTVDSKFFIENDPKREHGKAVVVLQERSGGTVLENNAIVQGSVKPTILDDVIGNLLRNSSVASQQIQEAIEKLKENLSSTSQDMEKDLADILDELSKQLDTFSNEMKKVPDREEIRQLEKSIKQFSDELNQAQKNVRDHIQNEILPQLRQQLDQIREKLRKEGRDHEIERIDQEMNEMIHV